MPGRLRFRAFPLSRRDDAASEIMGYIMMFALSAGVLVISLQSFSVAKESSEELVASSEMQAIANRVAARLVEVSKVAEEFPNATYNVTLRVPEQIQGRNYRVHVNETDVRVATPEGDLAANATTFKLDAVTDLTINGTALSSSGRVIVSYEKDALGRKWLNVTGGS